MAERKIVPIACTLEANDAADRTGEWAQVVARAEERIRTDDGIRLRFPAEPALAATLAELAAKEADCCAFFDFSLSLAHGETWFQSPPHPTANPSHRPLRLTAAPRSSGPKSQNCHRYPKFPSGERFDQVLNASANLGEFVTGGRAASEIDADATGHKGDACVSYKKMVTRLCFGAWAGPVVTAVASPGCGSSGRRRTPDGREDSDKFVRPTVRHTSPPAISTTVATTRLARHRYCGNSSRGQLTRPKASQSRHERRAAAEGSRHVRVTAANNTIDRGITSAGVTPRS